MIDVKLTVDEFRTILECCTQRYYNLCKACDEAARLGNSDDVGYFANKKINVGVALLGFAGEKATNEIIHGVEKMLYGEGIK